MTPSTPERPFPANPLHERYASREMAALFSNTHRFGTWRRLWIELATVQKELGLPISGDQIGALERVRDAIDLERVAALERQTRHDVVAHLRHFAEQAGEAGGILHLGATSAFITDNTDALILRDALDILISRTARVVHELAGFAREHADLPTLAFTHFQPAQLTTVGKRACLWLQDFAVDLEELERRRQRLLCRGAKGTTGTQASYLVLFDGDHERVRRLDAELARRLGFAGSWPVTGQTYPRKQDSQILQTLAGVGESCHKLGGDLRLLQGIGELSEPFDDTQVGSSAMAYKRNPVRSERMCGLARRLFSDALNGPLNAGTQWLERSLDDSANRRLVLADTMLTADAVLTLAAGLAAGLRVNGSVITARVARELPFMATETFLMAGTLRGGDRQELHEAIRQHSLAAHAAVQRGQPNPLLDLLAGDQRFGMSRAELEEALDAHAFTGRSAAQVAELIDQQIEPLLRRFELAALEEPRI